jgi:hypothetical protein
MTDVLHVGILNPCIAICERRIGSHQALLLQAQDDKIEDQDTECQDAAIQYPELADVMGQEIWNDQVLPQYPCNRIPTVCPGKTQSLWHSKPHCTGDAQHWPADAACYISSCLACVNIRKKRYSALSTAHIRLPATSVYMATDKVAVAVSRSRRISRFCVLSKWISR